MSATQAGPFANILSERAALLAVVAGAVTTVVEEEPDDGLGLEEEGEGEVMVAEVEMPEVIEIVGSGIEELLDTVKDVPESDVLEAVATDVLEVVGGNSVIGPGPRLNRRIN
jgi:hypothetical protein